MNRLFHLQEIAKRTGFTTRTIRKHFETQQLRGVKVGARWTCAFSDLARWLGEERALEIFGEDEVGNDEAA